MHVRHLTGTVCTQIKVIVLSLSEHTARSFRTQVIHTAAFCSTQSPDLTVAIAILTPGRSVLKRRSVFQHHALDYFKRQAKFAFTAWRLRATCLWDRASLRSLHFYSPLPLKMTSPCAAARTANNGATTARPRHSGLGWLDAQTTRV